jgi:secreted PhoX family phosphatase
MAAFAGPNGTTILVRNHEIGYEPADDPAIKPVPDAHPYDTAVWGGTTAVVVDADRNEVVSYVASSGTIWNCAGGATPWGTWLTCEETTSQLISPAVQGLDEAVAALARSKPGTRPARRLENGVPG